MKKNLILSISLLLFILGFWVYYKQVIERQPALMVELQRQIAERKRQLLSAQVISKNLQNVNELIQNNLVSDLSDSLAQPASIQFLTYLTGLMDRLGIVLISMRPLEIVDWQQTSNVKLISQDYIEIPYSMEMLASYTQLGKFLEELEKYPRLINVTQIQLQNPIDAAFYEGEVSGKPDQHKVTLELHTLTILKASFESGTKQYN